MAGGDNKGQAQRRNVVVRALLGIMACWIWGGPGAKANESPTSSSLGRVVITVLDWTPGRTRQRLDLKLEYDLQRRPSHLLNFAAHWSDPVQLDELVASTYLHHGYIAPRLEIHRAQVDGRSVDLAARKDGLHYEYPQGGGVLTVHASLTVPRGPWPLGCVRRRCAAMGAIALLPAQQDPEGEASWLLPARYEVRWRAPRRPADLVIHDSDRHADDPLLAPGMAWGMQRGGTRPSRSFWHRGLEVQIHGALAPYHRSLRHRSRWPWPRHQLDHLERLSKEAIDTALAAGQPLAWGQRLTIVVGPLRATMAQSYDQMVLVSDRYLDTVPLRRFSKFHDAQVVRSLLDALTLRALVGKAPSRSVPWLAGAIGASLVPAWRERKKLRDEDMSQILAPLGFLPGVDEILYSGQSSQSSSFFRSVDDSMPLRRHPFYFSNELPGGRRIYRKLASRLGPAGFSRWRRLVYQDPTGSPVAYASQVADTDLGPFFTQWLGVYPSVDYAVGETESIKIKGGYRHRITVRRSADGPVRETIQVRVIDKTGQRVDLPWTPRGAGSLVSTLSVQTQGPLKSVEIDPEGRLRETARTPSRPWEREANGDPRFDNRRPAHRRLVYTGVYFNLALAEMIRAKTRKSKLRAFAGFISMEAGQRRDLRRMFYLRLSKSRESWLSGRFGINIQLGPKVTGNRRMFQLRADTNFDWLADAGLDATPGVRFRQRLSLTRDTRRFYRAPEGGHRARLALSRSDLLVNTQDQSAAHRAVWSLAASYSQYLRIVHNHVLALRGAVAWTLPRGPREFRGLLRAGGIRAFTAFAADEVFTRAMASIKAEYRHVFADSLRLNGLGLLWLRSLGGVAFTGVASVAPCEGLSGWGRKESYIGQVGYGLALRYDIFGIAPQLMRVDVALPLGRRRRECLGRVFPDALAQRQGIDPAQAWDLLAPVSVNLSFAHDF